LDFVDVVNVTDYVLLAIFIEPSGRDLLCPVEQNGGFSHGTENLEGSQWSGMVSMLWLVAKKIGRIKQRVCPSSAGIDQPSPFFSGRGSGVMRFTTIQCL
jgi:hypothetical protein